MHQLFASGLKCITGMYVYNALHYMKRILKLHSKGEDSKFK